jgi:hypothetical protein
MSDEMIQEEPQEENIEYWASEPADELVATLESKEKDYCNYLVASGRSTLMLNSYNQYYYAQYHLGGLQRSGQNNEFRLIGVNHFRNIISNVLAQITQQKPAWNPRSVNSDSKTLKQTIVASSLCDYYMTQKHFDRVANKAVEIALITGHADVALEWDESLGKEITKDEASKSINEGDVVAEALDPVNSIFDYNYSDVKNCPWRLLRRFVSKQDLAKKYPDHEDAIMSATLNAYVLSIMLDQTRYTKQIVADKDVVPVYYFYHEKTANLPDGRFLLYCGGEALLDTPLPYDSLPVTRIYAGENINNGFGWTVAFDLLPLQRTYDKVSSIIVTNLAYWGLSTIVVPKGGGYNVHPNVGGLNILEVDLSLGTPNSINFNQTPTDAFNFLGQLETNMQTLAGVNSVVRGDPAASLKSGAALALVASQSLIFNSPLANSYTDLLQSVGTMLISMFKLYVKTDRLIEVSGISNKSYLQSFSSEDLTDIFRVQVDMGSAISKTVSGRLQIASELLETGQITPVDYIMVLSTGNLSQILEKTQKKEIAIRAENEELMSSNPVRVLITDDHVAHILGHRTVLDDPDSRRGTPEGQSVQEVTLAHIQEHINMMQTMNPELAKILGLPAMGSGEPSPEAPQAPGPLPVEPSPNAPIPPALETGQNVKGPNMPNLPAGTPPNLEQAYDQFKDVTLPS